MPQTAISVGVAPATLLLPPSAEKRIVSIQNNGAVVVYVIRKPDDAAANGKPVYARSSSRWLKSKGDNLRSAFYALTLTGTADVRVEWG